MAKVTTFYNLPCLIFFITCVIFKIQGQYRDRDSHYDYDDYRPFDEPTSPKPKKQINPCHSSNHRIISNQPERSYNYRLGSGTHRERVLCDRDLTPGWYRFQSLAGNTIPTSCPGVNYCGTRAPVWMKGTIPTMEEGITEASGCISVQGKCCTTQIAMLVRNCSDFIVYHLRPTPACPAAYCAGYEVPCPVGLSSDTGYTPCHFPVDLLETKVSIGMSKENKIQFFCDVTLGGHVVPESVALEVEWLADDETVQSETFGLLQQHKGVLKEDKWTIGQTLHCRARARHTSINTFTAVVTSPPFNTGVSISSPQTQTAYEGGEPAYIEIQTNIPIICPKKKKEPKKDKKKEESEEEEEEEEECCVIFEVATKGSNSPRCADGTIFDMVVLKSCTFKICGDEWNSTHKIPVWAINDGLVGGAADSDSDYSSVYIDIKTVEPSPRQDIILPTQEVIISHADVEEKCIADEFITTFDGVSYLNQLEGVFVLYRHTELPYEVQIQLKKCNQRPLCNCAVAIRFGDVMLATDICSTGKMKFWSYTSDGSYIEPNKIAHLPQIIRIDEGRSFQVQFPSGTRVNLGPNLRFISIQASTTDADHTSGLCGSFDRDASNDFATFKGQIVCTASKNVTGPCDDFSKSWRLLSDQSLFSGTFNNDGYDFENDELVPEESSPGHCSCSSLKKATTVELRPKANSKFSSYPYEEYQQEEAPEEETEENNKNKCSSVQCVDPRGTDITVQLLDLVFDEDYAPEDAEIRSSNDAAQLSPVFYGGSSSPLTLQTQLKKEWNEDEAEIFCLRMIEGVPTTKLCRDIAHVDVDIHTKACKQDILFTKSPVWSVDALEQLRWECRDQVYHNLSIWEPQLGRRHGTPPLAILSSLCLNNCTGVGSCENGNCRCPKGIAGADCSVDTNQAPTVTSLNHDGICDIRNKPCSEILIWGDRFATHSSLKCHFDIYRMASAKSVPVLSGSVTTNGRLLTYQSIICDVPDLPIHDAKVASFYIPGEGLEKTKALMRLRVAYGSESPPSDPLDFAIFDSLCWECDRPLSCQARPTQSCNVLTEPFGSSSDPFQTSFNSPPAGFAHTSSPLQYSPDTSIAFTPATIYQHGVSPVPGQQLQLHPQLSVPCMLEKETGPCRNDILRYFYDASARRCRPFIFGGCQGNSNNFVSEQDCLAQCSSRDDSHNQQSIPGNAALSSEQLDQFIKSTMDPAEKIPKQCLLESNSGQCKDEIVRYYFDFTSSKCRPFIFGGCGGNANNYLTKEACSEECEAPGSRTQTQIAAPLTT